MIVFCMNYELKLRVNLCSRLSMFTILAYCEVTAPELMQRIPGMLFIRCCGIDKLLQMLLPKLFHLFDSCCACTGGWQHGRPPKQVLCYSEGPEAQTGGHPGLGLHGARAPDPVLQIDPLQANQNYLLQRRGV